MQDNLRYRNYDPYPTREHAKRGRVTHTDRGESFGWRWNLGALRDAREKEYLLPPSVTIFRVLRLVIKPVFIIFSDEYFVRKVVLNLKESLSQGWNFIRTNLGIYLQYKKFVRVALDFHTYLSRR